MHRMDYARRDGAVLVETSRPRLLGKSALLGRIAESARMCRLNVMLVRSVASRCWRRPLVCAMQDITARDLLLFRTLLATMRLAALVQWVIIVPKELNYLPSV